MKNIYEIDGLAKRYIGDRKLGFVGLNTKRPLYRPLRDIIRNIDFMTYTNEAWGHGGGGLAKNYHTTVRYGFLPEVKKVDLRRVARTITVPNYLSVEGLEIFPGIKGQDPYEVLVVRVSIEFGLREANEQFGVLPNLTTFPYKPHITLGYFEKGAISDPLLRRIRSELKANVGVISWNFGS